MKEFLTSLGIDYHQPVNVAAEPQAMEELRALGVRTVPVVVRGTEYVFAQELADVSRFVGRDVAFERLPAPELMKRWLRVLSAAQQQATQIPPQAMGQWATAGRERSIRDLACHIYQVPDAFLALVERGEQDLPKVYNAAPPAHVAAPDDIRAFGARITERLEQWWAATPDKACSGTVKTYYGEQPLHHVLERCTWHSAQHVRQVQAVLEGLGVHPEPKLGPKDYEGLPMPKGLWE